MRQDFTWMQWFQVEEDLLCLLRVTLWQCHSFSRDTLNGASWYDMNTGTWHSGYLSGCVTSCNTHKTIATTSGLFQISVPPLSPHTTSEILEPSFLHLNLVVINFWPWTLSIVKSHSCFLSDPGLSVLIIHVNIACAVFSLHLCYPCPHTSCTSNIPINAIVTSECTALLSQKSGIRGVSDMASAHVLCHLLLRVQYS